MNTCTPQPELIESMQQALAADTEYAELSRHCQEEKDKLHDLAESRTEAREALAKANVGDLAIQKIFAKEAELVLRKIEYEISERSEALRKLMTLVAARKTAFGHEFYKTEWRPAVHALCEKVIGGMLDEAEVALDEIRFREQLQGEGVTTIGLPRIATGRPSVAAIRAHMLRLKIGYSYEVSGDQLNRLARLVEAENHALPAAVANENGSPPFKAAIRDHEWAD